MLAKVTELSAKDKDELDRYMVKFFNHNKEADTLLADVLPNLERDKREIENLIDSYSIDLGTYSATAKIFGVLSALATISTIAEYVTDGVNKGTFVLSGITIGLGLATAAIAVAAEREKNIFSLEKAYINEHAPTIRATVRA